MFKSEPEIYQHIGQAMFNALPKQWESASFYFRLLSETGACEFQQAYLLDGETCHFSVNEIDGEYQNSRCADAFRALYKLMKTNDIEQPWNKARFELKPDGDFDIQFKFDEDFAWLNTVDRDSHAYSILTANDMSKIKSWEGVPEDFDRYWLK